MRIQLPFYWCTHMHSQYTYTLTCTHAYTYTRSYEHTQAYIKVQNYTYIRMHIHTSLHACEIQTRVGLSVDLH